MKQWPITIAVLLTLILTACQRQTVPPDPTSQALMKQNKNEPLTPAETALVTAYQEQIKQEAAILRAERAANDQLKQQTQQARDKRSAGEKLTLAESELLAKADQEEAKRKEQAAAAELRLPPSQPNCGLLGCVSSPFLRAKLGDRVVGRPVSEAVGIAGAPTASVAVGNITYLTWRRMQRDGSALYVCEETVSVRDSQIGGYRFEGNC
jgi:hypothetical protein